MANDPNQQDFVLTIADVFTLSGRGVAVIGPIESGLLRTGDEVEIWDDHKLIGSARAQVEMICVRDADPRAVLSVNHKLHDLATKRAGPAVPLRSLTGRQQYRFPVRQSCSERRNRLDWHSVLGQGF